MNKGVSVFSNFYSKILSRFPIDNLTYSFAYGSGAVKQLNNAGRKNMIDFIFVVNDAEKWHNLNLRQNPNHYSALSFFGSKVIAKVQTNIPSRVYFNSMVHLKEDNVLIKYGVIEENDLIADLLDWNDIYLAGRLHKPVETIKTLNSSDLKAALQLNLQSAVHCTLLLLPENFSEIQFYKTITSLSYNGDFRMKFGEDKDKVHNIVHGALEQFRNLYEPVIKLNEEYVDFPKFNGSDVGDRMCCQDVSPSAKHFHLNHLPRIPQRKLVQFWNKGLRNRQDAEDVLQAMSFDEDCGKIIHNILSDIVWDSSVKQSLKGILTAGFLKSVLYSAKKIRKMISSKKIS